MLDAVADDLARTIEQAAVELRTIDEVTAALWSGRLTGSKRRLSLRSRVSAWVGLDARQMDMEMSWTR